MSSGADKNYIKILIESMDKKSRILDQIIEKNKEQKEIIKESKLDMDVFEENLQEKEKLIEELGILDDGFQRIYDRIKEELLNHRENYKEEIRSLQSYIAVLTDKSMQIQVEEARNKALIEEHFSTIKKEIKQAKVGRKAASDYYRAMNKLEQIQPQFMDKKK